MVLLVSILEKKNGLITLLILSFVLPQFSLQFSLYKTSLLLNIEPLGPSVGPLQILLNGFFNSLHLQSRVLKVGIRVWLFITRPDLSILTLSL